MEFPMIKKDNKSWDICDVENTHYHAPEKCHGRTIKNVKTHDDGTKIVLGEKKKVKIQ